MTHRTKLEKVLELLINEETEQASELLHEIIVEKARDIYGEIVSESEVTDKDDEEGKEEDKEEGKEEKVDEDFGGDMKDSYADEIGQDKEEIKSDQIFNDAESSEAGEESGEEGAEHEGSMEGEKTEIEMLSDLEAELASLKAMIASIPGVESAEGSEEGQEGGMDMGMDMGAGDESDSMEAPVETIGEATQFSKDVGSTGQEKEGKLVGTGKNSKAGEINKSSLKAPARKEYGGKEVQFSKKAGEGKGAEKSAQQNSDAPKNHNISVDKKDVKADVSGEGKFVGTGKNSKTAPVNTKSVLSKRP
jgi:hypothetical protein